MEMPFACANSWNTGSKGSRSETISTFRVVSEAGTGSLPAGVGEAPEVP